MTTTEMSAQYRKTPGSIQHHRKQPRSTRPNRVTYVSWREPMSVRQANALFESAVLPDLTGRLECLLYSLDDDEREEAVQDCICQAFEAYRALKLYMAGDGSPYLVNVSAALAEHSAAQYHAGVRFASPRTEFRL